MSERGLEKGARPEKMGMAACPQASTVMVSTLGAGRGSPPGLSGAAQARRAMRARAELALLQAYLAMNLLWKSWNSFTKSCSGWGSRERWHGGPPSQRGVGMCAHPPPVSLAWSPDTEAGRPYLPSR